MSCEHLEFNSYANVERYTKEDGALIGFSVRLRLECRACGEAFHFGRFPRFTDGSRKEIRLTCGPGDAPMEAPWVPGHFQCPKCEFYNVLSFLNANSGAISPDRKSEPEKCPNDGEQMRRVTWQQHAADLAIGVDRLSARVRSLEDAWPEGAAMPVEGEVS